MVFELWKPWSSLNDMMRPLFSTDLAPVTLKSGTSPGA
jgi:hypothetical protein